MFLSIIRRAACHALCLALAAGPALAQSAAPPKVSVGVLYVIADSGLFIAKERGYFREQGLDVDFVKIGSAGDAVALLATDKMDVGSGGASPGLFNAFRRGIDVQIVASKSIMMGPNWGSGSIVVRKDLVDSGKVRTVADLKGMRVAINNPQSVALNYLVRGLQAGGLGRGDVDIVEMPFSQYIPALQRKAVDAVLPLAPLSETITNTLKLGVELPETMAIRTSNYDLTNIMFYSPGFAAGPAATRFMIAYLKGVRDYYDAIIAHKTAAADVCAIIHRYIATAPADCSGVAMSGADPNGAVNLPSLERYQQEWLQWGVMQEPADIGKNVNTAFIDAAVAKLGRY